MEKESGINGKVRKARRHNRRAGEVKVYNQAEILRYQQEKEMMMRERESAEFQSSPEESYWNISEQLRLFAGRREQMKKFDKLLSMKKRLEKEPKERLTKHPELTEKQLKLIAERLRIMAKPLQPKHRRLYIEWK